MEILIIALNIYWSNTFLGFFSFHRTLCLLIKGTLWFETIIFIVILRLCGSKKGSGSVHFIAYLVIEHIFYQDTEQHATPMDDKWRILNFFYSFALKATVINTIGSVRDHVIFQGNIN